MTDHVNRLAVALEDRYVIERELGQGGMATVYLALDVRHDRKVALKVLRPELAAVIGAERFLAEIKTTANLQHPHILALFDSGEADGFVYYVMPYVEGESLRDRLVRDQQLPVDEAVRIATETADALEYAHRQGIVHRDIKPENVLLHGGHAQVADFGIALAVSRSEGGTRLTDTGMSLGTPHYMSPEQAMGQREITPRADVYALGCVLYEMLTAEPPFTGATAQAIIARVMTEQPRRLAIQRHTIPEHVEAAVLKAIEKLPADRFATAAEFVRALETPGWDAASASRATAAAASAPARRGAAARWAPWAAAAALAAVAAIGWLRQPPAPTVARYGLAFVPGQEPIDGLQQTFALAPDGSWIVYDGPSEQGSQLWIKRRDQYDAAPVPGTGHGGPPATAPAVSPDGEWIVFAIGSQLRRVPRGGGSAITVVDSVSGTTRGVAWLDDGTIVYRDVTDRLRRVPDAGGAAEVVWTPPDTGDLRPRFPRALPQARGVLFNVCDISCSVNELWVTDFRSGQSRRLATDAGQGWYVPTGHVVYVRLDGGVFAMPFDLGALAVTGAPVPVLEGVQVQGVNYPDMAVSRSGSLLMIAGPAGGVMGGMTEARWVTRDGTATPVDPAWRLSMGGNVGWALSPDGRRLAIAQLGTAGPDVWVKELDRGPQSRLTADPAGDYRPRWPPDGRSVSFISTRGHNQDLFVRRADGTLPEELVVDLDEPIFEAVWSRDGRWLVLRTGAEGGRDIWAQQLGVDSAPRLLLASDFDERAVTLSPDAKWLAYQSDETGQNEIYIRPFPDVSTGKWTVSVGGGSRPLWAHNGEELFYIDGADERMMVARIRASATIEVVERRALFPVDGYLLSANYTPFDVSPDDQRFLMAVPAGAVEGARTALIIVENWFEEVKQKLAR